MEKIKEKKIKTQVGPMFIRDKWDRAVIKEVIQDHEYERWGDITIKKGDLVVDCGAHIGSFTRLALFHKARVLSIGAEEDNFRMLKKNTEGFSLVLLKTIIWDGKPVSFLIDKKRGELHKVSTKGKKMPSVSLDELVELFEISEIDLLKMDIEGAEYEVLSNFKRLDLVKQISLEWHYGAVNLATLIIYFEKNGFKTVWLGGNGDWGKLQLKRR